MKVRRRLKTPAHLFVLFLMKDVMHHMEQCVKIMCLDVVVLPLFAIEKCGKILHFSRHIKKHMAYRKKYKPCILKYKALISKYMPCIFRLYNSLINNVF